MKDLFINDDGFIKHNGIKIIEVKEGQAQLEVEITDKSLNPYKIAHGGLIFGLADTASGIAVYSVVGPSLTISSNINYLRAASCKKLIANAQIEKKGHKIVFSKCDITSETGELIETVTSTLSVIQKNN